ncbi:UNKNOWN [Stylonychia lemnae]|uniref:Transmembrane protein n=1 Tax=Stylonychia lemnae TaxID=5949 RepID=A0A078ADA7_STYLE|nr:UNKNOWN [Stylonychia lemnae]|eukprot:CDW79826.1 UNKNOWN [Stylonychia lemnae]
MQSTDSHQKYSSKNQSQVKVRQDKFAQFQDEEQQIEVYQDKNFDDSNRNHQDLKQDSLNYIDEMRFEQQRGAGKKIIVKSSSSVSSFSESKFILAKRRPLSMWTMIGVFYWFLNSLLGFYIVLKFQEPLQIEYPLAYDSILAFSLKWITAAIISIFILVFLCLIIKVFSRQETYCESTIGAFPTLYLLVIHVQYMFSLYYCVLIVMRLYQNEYDNLDNTENLNLEFNLKLLIAIYCGNEILVSLSIIVLALYHIFGGGLRRSHHLEELEGDAFDIDDKQVQKLQQELQESRIRTESLRKEMSIGYQDPTRLSQLKEDMIREILQDSQQRVRSVSHDPYQNIKQQSIYGNSQIESPQVRKSQSPESYKQNQSANLYGQDQKYLNFQTTRENIPNYQSNLRGSHSLQKTNDQSFDRPSFQQNNGQQNDMRKSDPNFKLILEATINEEEKKDSNTSRDNKQE